MYQKAFQGLKELAHFSTRPNKLEGQAVHIFKNPKQNKKVQKL